MKQREGIRIDGHRGTWYVLDEKTTDEGRTLYLLEHEKYGEDAACIIVDADKNIIMEDVFNGFGDLDDLEEL